MSPSASSPAPFVSAAGTVDAAAVARDMISFIDASWTQFHAVAAAASRLEAAGFVRISERDSWEDSSKHAVVKPGGRYYFTRSGSTLVAFAVGGKAQPGAPFHMVGAHTDSPCLKVKPVSAGVKSGYAMVNVEPYGGGLWTTWFDRDLTVAGRVLVKKKENGSGGGSSSDPNADAAAAAPPRIEARLVAVDRPLLRVPMLAIHLQRELAEGGFKPNKQQHVVPVLASAVKKAISEGKEKKKEKEGEGDAEKNNEGDGEDGEDKKTTPPLAKKHHPALLELIARELSVPVDDIVDFDLNVCDTQRGALGGADEEFVFVGRLDNLAMSYCATAALVDAFGEKSPGGAERLSNETAVKAVALFDHEEVGSSSAQGAGGPVMRDAMFRVSRALAASFVEASSSNSSSPSLGDAAARSAQSSFLVSADMAHALHPNYADRHEPDHRPAFGKGLVIKHNANQRYATDALSAALFREVGSRRPRDRGGPVPSQEFCVRSDMACGSTIGPILASGLGVRTVDVGAPQLSMHSIREMCAVEDVSSLLVLFFLSVFFFFSFVDLFFRPRPHHLIHLEKKKKKKTDRLRVRPPPCLLRGLLGPGRDSRRGLDRPSQGAGGAGRAVVRAVRQVEREKRERKKKVFFRLCLFHFFLQTITASLSFFLHLFCLLLLQNGARPHHCGLSVSHREGRGRGGRREGDGRRAGARAGRDG